MQLEDYKAPLLKQLVSGHYASQYAAVNALEPDVIGVDPGDCVSVKTRCGESYEALAKSLMPWRKGPFQINDLLIDSEWRSFVKYNLLLPHLNLAGKRVLDVGCNNGYYLFRMLDLKPASLTGFDPSALFYLQFLFINRFIRSNIRYELLGVQHLVDYGERFDTVFCLGVLYHRSDPIGTLKALASALEKGGELILDTFMIEGDGAYCLTPKERYSKIPNIWFIPTIPALFNWLERTGFEAARVLEIKPADAAEQRKTAWIEGESLESFLDPQNPAKTVEGYPAPVRVYISARRR